MITSKSHVPEATPNHATLPWTFLVDVDTLSTSHRPHPVAYRHRLSSLPQVCFSDSEFFFSGLYRKGGRDGRGTNTRPGTSTLCGRVSETRGLRDFFAEVGSFAYEFPAGYAGHLCAQGKV